MQGQTILVMGDMAELGEQAEEMHRHIGRYAQQAGIKQMFCVGEFSAFAAQAFAGNHFLSQQDLLLALQTSLHTISERRVSATVLVKGSRSSGMDRLITSLTEKGVLSC
jgi:UDP-N-acetylmuramoyl-tripeptide--D-alanyl-D-alanine ligase